MRLDDKDSGAVMRLLRLTGRLTLVLTLAAMSGCGDDEEPAEQNAGGMIGESGNPEQIPVAKPNSPEAAIYAALDDSVERLKKGDLHGFIEYYIPLKELTRIRSKPDGIDRMAEELAEETEQLNWLISVLERARKGTPELDERGYTATIVLPVPPKKEVPEEPVPPANVIPEPVLTSALISGYGSDLGRVLSSATAALNEGDTEGFVANLFPASELRHPDAATRLAALQTRLASNPQMVEQMKTDLVLASELSPKMEDGGRTAVFEIAGSEVPYGRGKVTLPDRTFKFQLVEGSWRLFDNSTAMRKEIARQSALEPPSMSEFQTESEEPEGEYITLERLGDQWRLGDLKAKRPRR